MKRKLIAPTCLLIGLIIGYTLHWYLSERFDRNNLKESFEFMTSDEGTKLFDALKDAGINKEELDLVFDDSKLRIQVNVTDDRVDSLVEMLEDVSPSHPVSLEVRSERGGVFFLPGGTMDFRDLMDRLNHREKTPSEQGGADQPATAPESKSEGSDKPKPDSEGRPQ